MTSPDPQHTFIETWLPQLQKQGRSRYTIQAYRRGWEHLAHWYGQTYGEACDPARLIGVTIFLSGILALRTT
jgi:hypothetical protein